MLAKVTTHLEAQLKLEVKQPVWVGRSVHGLRFCGYRIHPERLLLTRRRKHRYALCRRRGELRRTADLVSGSVSSCILIDRTKYAVRTLYPQLISGDSNTLLAG